MSEPDAATQTHASAGAEQTAPGTPTVPTTTDLSTDPSSELPPFPPGGVTAGVDWASTDHAVALVDDTGAAIDRFTVTAKRPDCASSSST